MLVITPVKRNAKKARHYELFTRLNLEKSGITTL
jgi:hypothetical protein